MNKLRNLTRFGAKNCTLLTIILNVYYFFTLISVFTTLCNLIILYLHYIVILCRLF